MNTFSASNSIKFAWETFKKRPWFLIGAAAIVIVASSVSSSVTQNLPTGFMAFLGSLIGIAISTFIDMGLTNLSLKAHDDISIAKFEDLWNPKPFWNYLGVSILTGLLAAIGFVLLIVPGVMVTLMLFFVKFIVIDQDLSPIAAMKESVRMTDGHKWQLLSLLAFALVINILGAMLLLVGLLVTIPVTTLAIAHAYRTLKKSAAVTV